MKCFFFVFFFFILTESGRGRHYIVEKEDGFNGTIVPFVTSDKGLSDTSGRVELVWASASDSEDSANVSQGRTNVNIQSIPVKWAVRKVGGASPAMQGLTDHLLGLLTRVSACPICPFNKCTFVWTYRTCWKFVFKLVINFENFFHKIFIIPIFAAMYAVNVTSPAQLPLVSGCQNSGELWYVFFSL